MQSTINYGDTAWMLTSTALVLLMTAPGLALFYGGLVRRKNVLSTMMQSFFILCLISIQWLLWGYSIAFGPDVGHLFGNLAWFIGLSAESSDFGGYIIGLLSAALSIALEMILEKLGRDFVVGPPTGFHPPI